jgi:hypothetical protein
MNIVQEFVERNDLLLGKVAEDNPSLGAALIEALAVINYYATTNNVSFDDAQKEQILASEEVAVQEPTVAEKKAVKPVLKQIDEAIAASHQMTPIETKWVIENWDDRALYALLQRADSENIAGYITQGQGANAAMYFLILDDKLSNNSGFTQETQDLIDSQKQMKRDELDELLKGEQIATTSKWVIEASGANNKYMLTVLGEEADKRGISREILDGESGNALLVMDKQLSLKQGAHGWAVDLLASQKQMTQDEIDQALKGEQPTQVMPEATPVETHTPETPIVHASKEFVEDDIIVSAEDLEALKQLEDLEDLGDINLDDLDI